jgi:myo-inositol 2-dehydrogenase / D-chiro-inositol 1-dehydrogenase
VPAYADFMQRFQPAYQAELAAFVATVIEGGPSACTLHEARAALHVALAADRSRNERRPVALGEIAHTQVIAG